MCINNRCQNPGGCVEDSECPPGQTCIAGLCETLPPGECVRDADCNPGEVCQFNFCMPGTMCRTNGEAQRVHARPDFLCTRAPTRRRSTTP